jgi:uncharacterized membrane protein YcaP (DUF421 family)
LEWLTQVFGPDMSRLTWWQECARTLLIFGYGLVMVRLVGRRVFGKWAALDIVVSIIVGSSLSRAMTGSAPLFATLVAASELMGVHWLLAQFAARSQFVSRVLEGVPIEVARGGELDEKARKRQSVSRADIEEAVRLKGKDSMDGVEKIILEPSGRIAVLAGEAAAPKEGA